MAPGGGRRVSKYGAKPVTHDGYRFPSTAEGNRYLELKLLERAGEISRLVVHPRFDLHVSGQKIGVCELDFQYFGNRGKAIFNEDVKGRDLPLSRWKRRHVEAEYGIRVVLIMPRQRGRSRAAAKAKRAA